MSKNNNHRAALSFLSMAALFGGANLGMSPGDRSPKQWKPKFSEKELARVRALPKKERKNAVAELRAKYLAKKGGGV